MYMLGLIADDGFLIVFNKVQEEKKKSLMCYQVVEVVEYLCFEFVIKNVTNVVLLLHYCFCESLS